MDKYANLKLEASGWFKLILSELYLAEVTRMVLVEVDSVVMHATSITTTTRMLSVLANTAMTVAHMATQLPGLLLLC